MTKGTHRCLLFFCVDNPPLSCYTVRESEVLKHEQNNLHHQQYSSFKPLYFDLLDGICRRIVLPGGRRLGYDIFCSRLLDARVRHHCSHTDFLYFGNCFLCFELEKRALSWRVLGTAFAIWNIWGFYTVFPCSHLFVKFHIVIRQKPIEH